MVYKRKGYRESEQNDKGKCWKDQEIGGTSLNIIGCKKAKSIERNTWRNAEDFNN